VKATLPDIDDPLLKYLRRKKMTSPTFTTPGAAIDWMLEKPEKREIVVEEYGHRIRFGDEVNRFDCICGSSGGDWLKMKNLASLFESKKITGHESRDAEDELREACNNFRRALQNANVGMLIDDEVFDFANAIIAARK